MKITQTQLPGITLIQPEIHGDARGFFTETYQSQRYREGGIDATFVQDNLSRSERGVLRGLHFQVEKPQGKLVSCPRGSVFDVAVDVDPSSSTFKQYVAVELNEENHLQMWIPPGYAHGFCVLSEVADFHYKCTEFYQPSLERGVFWNDPDIGIRWPVTSPTLSAKDGALPRLAELSHTQG
ncbi:MAG TPA: dTDP-4-dehydrorhamnose 3,5-epimerase [Gammaproteobacteria bacterium]|nr:dTDP-4-dehydrorhamnose 3,5-epimerase [Gammaproteobacteria bacterium]|tara:strand:- start:249 stop:791 length:543 start_codon:yes stop_codon:yes gene_type:complete